MSIHGELSIGAMLVLQFPFSELKNSNNSQESRELAQKQNNHPVYLREPSVKGNPPPKSGILVWVRSGFQGNCAKRT